MSPIPFGGKVFEPNHENWNLDSKQVFPDSIDSGKEVCHVSQCDQLAIFVVQYLDVYNIENLPNNIKIAKVGSKFCQAPNRSSRNTKAFNFLPKWQNFAKSGHTALNGGGMTGMLKTGLDENCNSKKSNLAKPVTILYPRL